MPNCFFLSQHKCITKQKNNTNCVYIACKRMKQCIYTMLDKKWSCKILQTLLSIANHIPGLLVWIIRLTFLAWHTIVLCFICGNKYRKWFFSVNWFLLFVHIYMYLFVYKSNFLFGQVFPRIRTLIHLESCGLCFSVNKYLIVMNACFFSECLIRQRQRSTSRNEGNITTHTNTS